jgi:hypothetical protein
MVFATITLLIEESSAWDVGEYLSLSELVCVAFSQTVGHDKFQGEEISLFCADLRWRYYKLEFRYP